MSLFKNLIFNNEDLTLYSHKLKSICLKPIFEKNGKDDIFQRQKLYNIDKKQNDRLH